jgi:hypothetical protein
LPAGYGDFRLRIAYRIGAGLRSGGSEAITPVSGKPGLFRIVAVTPEISGFVNAGAVSVIGELPDGNTVSSNQVNIAVEGTK